MLDIRTIVEQPAQIKAALEKRSDTILVSQLDAIVEMDEKRKVIIQEVETLKQQRNQASQEIAKIKKEKGDATENIKLMKSVSEKIKVLDQSQSEVELRISEAISHFPNVLDSDVPDGASEQDNKEVRVWGTKPEFKFTPKSHYEIGESMGLMDFKKAGEVTGARFVFLKGLAARLERALVSFMLDSHSQSGYTEILPPFIVNRSTLFGTGQLPKFEEDVFKIQGHEFFLSPTAEVPVTNYHRGEILSEADLPLHYMAYTPCFRAEAGSYGKDTKGLKRQHQFQKVELVKFTRPETSNDELEKLVSDAESILKALKLPYRTVLLCGGDIGFSAAKTYDIEVWSPYTQSYMEISSCSNCRDFQARRANIRYRSDSDRKVHFVHTLNGSGLAVGRTLLALIENNQTEDGQFKIPEVLQKYL